jgi:hypothetical protein
MFNTFKTSIRRKFHSVYLDINYVEVNLSLCLSLSLMLLPTVSLPVCLGIKHPSGAYDQIFITVRQLRVCWSEALSLTRGWICLLQLLLALASAVIHGSESLWTRDHILLSYIRDFHIVASCDSQGYGGGIRAGLNTGTSCPCNKIINYHDTKTYGRVGV